MIELNINLNTTEESRGNTSDTCIYLVCRYRKEALISTLIYDEIPPGGVDAGPGGGLVGKINGGRGSCEKSKSVSRLPS